MPSLLVHVALAALVAAVLLDEEFDRRSLTVVLAVTAFPDLDAIVALFVPGTHRAALHTLLFPALLAFLVAVDVRRERSTLRTRHGTRGVRIAWVSILSLVCAGIALDLAHTGVNPLYPVYDRFYRFDGQIVVTTTLSAIQPTTGLFTVPGGVLQLGAPSWWPFGELPQLGGITAEGSTADTHHPSPFDPTMGPDALHAERKIWIAGDGIRLVFVLTAALVVSLRLALDSRR